VLSTPPDLKAGLTRDIGTYAEHLVSFLLRAVAASVKPEVAVTLRRDSCPDLHTR
jgi:hypothetical protein